MALGDGRVGPLISRRMARGRNGTRARTRRIHHPRPRREVMGGANRVLGRRRHFAGSHLSQYARYHVRALVLGDPFRKLRFSCRPDLSAGEAGPAQRRPRGRGGRCAARSDRGGLGRRLLRRRGCVLRARFELHNAGLDLLGSRGADVHGADTPYDGLDHPGDDRRVAQLCRLVGARCLRRFPFSRPDLGNHPVPQLFTATTACSG